MTKHETKNDKFKACGMLHKGVRLPDSSVEAPVIGVKRSGQSSNHVLNPLPDNIAGNAVGRGYGRGNPSTTAGRGSVLGCRNLKLAWQTEFSFFISHWGKTKSMVAMSRKLQYHGREELYRQGALAFWLFFMQYLIRDSIIYIVIPIYIAKLTV